MIVLAHDKLGFRFPDIHEKAVFNIAFQRTLRIPDDGKEYPLPAGLGNFPLRHIEDYANKLPGEAISRGGVLLPMYQSEALWINFSGGYPMAIKIGTGKINAITGKKWKNELNRKKQDYVVVPDQPWLDGYNVEEDLIRQFVAMPLGEGYSAEEQITGKSEFGGLQIIAYPMKKHAYEEYRKRKEESGLVKNMMCEDIKFSKVCASYSPMGMAAGGLMRQTIYEDEYGLDVWDQDNGSRCFIHLMNSESYKSITGEMPPYPPITGKDYRSHGIPWFDYYSDGNSLSGSKTLNKLKNLAKMAKKKKQPLKDNESIDVSGTQVIRKGNQVSEGAF